MYPDIAQQKFITGFGAPAQYLGIRTDTSSKRLFRNA
jgi:hypothetical protein